MSLLSHLGAGFGAGTAIIGDQAGLRIIAAQDDMFNGCPVLNKGRILSVPRGVAAILQWQIRDKAGQPVDISSVIADGDTTPDNPDGPGQVLLRYVQATGCSADVYQVEGAGHDSENGVVRVELPSEMVSEPGIYAFELGVVDGAGTLLLADSGLLSVERGLFGLLNAVTGDNRGPITLGELRTRLRDFQQVNDLADDYEFSDDELVHALLSPVREWNETPPSVGCYSAQNFPWHEAWLEATTAKLLRMAAHWYRRNKSLSQQVGVAIDERNRDQAYDLAARERELVWREFIMRTKAQINIHNCTGSV